MDSNKTLIFLPLTACILIDMPEGSEECSEMNPDSCIFCPITGRYISGETIDDTGGTGHTASLFLWFIATCIGIFGTVANLLIILILTKKRSQKSFDTLLVGLASFDLMCSIFTVMVAGVNTAYFQNWNRSRSQIEAYRVLVYFALFCRSTSSFTTVVIAIERFLVVTYPTTIHHWFTVKRARILICCVAAFSCLMSIPRFMSTYVCENHLKNNFSSVSKMDHIVQGTWWSGFWFGTLAGLHEIIDYWVPLPLLLVFNGLVFFKIREIAAKRKELNVKHRKEIRATQMFLPVVLILLICNLEPIIHLIYFYKGIIYRELEMASFVAFTFNSAVNLPVYYLKGSSFRKETKALLSSYFSCCDSSRSGKGETSVTATSGYSSNDETLKL